MARRKYVPVGSGTASMLCTALATYFYQQLPAASVVTCESLVINVLPDGID